jgi:hypothetical protein
VFLAAVLFLHAGGSSDATPSQREFFHYRPHPEPLQYNLSITTTSRALALFGPGPQEEHEDLLRLSQKVQQAGDGLLEIALTVDEINTEVTGPKASDVSLTPRGGSAYERKDIVGNTARTSINLLGVAKEVQGIPHFGSVYFHPQNLSGPPLDLYPAMNMLYPQFPLRLIKEGDRWQVEEEVSIESAQALPIRGIGTLKHELNMTVKKVMEYTLIGYVRKGNYQTAHIGFTGTFRMEGEMITEAGGNYIEGNGKSSGELYFAPGEGLLVEVSMKTEINQQKSEDGNVVHWFNSEVNMATFLAQRSAGLTWLTEQDLHFVLSDIETGGNKR